MARGLRRLVSQITVVPVIYILRANARGTMIETAYSCDSEIIIEYRVKWVYLSYGDVSICYYYIVISEI